MTHEERERFYIAAADLARFRAADRLLHDCLPGSEAFPRTDLNIDVRGALGHISVAIGELEAIVEEFMRDD